MERNDIGTNPADDVSFGGGSSASSSAGSAGGSTTDREVSPGIGVADTDTADASGISGSSTTTADGKLAAAKAKIGQAKEKVVDRMHATADWIKERDVEQLKGTIEQQVRDHPGRTLLIAAGLGYLIGRAFRGGNGSA